MRISDWSSDVCSSDLLKVAKELKVPMLTGGSTGAIATDANTPGDPWFFRFFADSTGQGNDTANAIINKFHAKRVAILHDTTGYGTALAKQTTDVVKAAGGAKIGRASCRERVCQYV